ncbi:hypothetical protein [Streptomyces sp. NPDC097619]|uniref:hypothetical protein n=1 Tax=Streptomyces sp. NPDC097619 TaxID=3157228 RepID=UPI00331FA119
MSYDYPKKLVQLQLAMAALQAEYARFVADLPRSVVPLDAHEGREGLWTARDPSPGYTEEQKARRTAYEADLRELSAQVSAHPYWASLPPEDRVAARQGLKKVEPGDEQAGE